MSNKLRPDNGPGSNGLRGGINVYSAKTTTGPWLEAYGGPALYKRGFTSASFQTEAQFAQLGAIRNSSGEFGAGLPLSELVREKTTTGQLFNPGAKSLGDTKWKTNSQVMNSSLTDEVNCSILKIFGRVLFL
jgi:hypothetical protein